jgi:hypothetical protein
MISDSVLPSKKVLLEICKDQLKIDHSAIISNKALPSIKDRIMLAIYVY